MNCLLKILLYKVFIGSAFTAIAYIPPPDMVLSRLNRNQGSGWYKISQKITFLETSQFTQSFQFNEVWYRGPNRAFVEVTSPDYPKLKIQFLYRDSKKTWKDSKGKTKSHNKNQNSVESYFFSESMRPKWLEQTSPLSLDRALGVVNYVFSFKERKLWVEQDEFVVRKIQIQPSFLLRAYDYQVFPRGLFFPKRREVISPEYQVRLEWTQTQPLKKGWKGQLSANKWESSIPDRDVSLVRKFYQSFR